jgi:hypothetical protein
MLSLSTELDEDGAQLSIEMLVLVCAGLAHGVLLAVDHGCIAGRVVSMSGATGLAGEGTADADGLVGSDGSGGNEAAGVRGNGMRSSKGERRTTLPKARDEEDSEELSELGMRLGLRRRSEREIEREMRGCVGDEEAVRLSRAAASVRSCEADARPREPLDCRGPVRQKTSCESTVLPRGIGEACSCVLRSTDAERALPPLPPKRLLICCAVCAVHGRLGLELPGSAGSVCAAKSSAERSELVRGSHLLSRRLVREVEEAVDGLELEAPYALRQYCASAFSSAHKSSPLPTPMSRNEEACVACVASETRGVEQLLCENTSLEERSESGSARGAVLLRCCSREMRSVPLRNVARRGEGETGALRSGELGMLLPSSASLSMSSAGTPL